MHRQTIAKNEDDIKPEKTTIHASNNNNAAEVHEEKSAESHPLLPLLNLLYCSAHTVDIKRSTIFWMADERISWRRKLPAVILYVSFREGMIKNFSIDGLASSSLSLVNSRSLRFYRMCWASMMGSIVVIVDDSLLTFLHELQPHYYYLTDEL